MNALVRFSNLLCCSVMFLKSSIRPFSNKPAQVSGSHGAKEWFVVGTGRKCLVLWSLSTCSSFSLRMSYLQKDSGRLSIWGVWNVSSPFSAKKPISVYLIKCSSFIFFLSTMS